MHSPTSTPELLDVAQSVSPASSYAFTGPRQPTDTSRQHDNHPIGFITPYESGSHLPELDFTYTDFPTHPTTKTQAQDDPQICRGQQPADNLTDDLMES